jgi:hypothetical protein
MSYKYGILLQLNNLDVGAIHDEKHLKYLFNALRDYVQTDGISWLLVGDVGLRSFVAQEVDRLDDIISYEVKIQSPTKLEYQDLLEKRIVYYRSNPKAQLPIDKDVFLYLYDITKGRLRYIFGLLQRLLNNLFVGDLTDRITLAIAKPMITQLARERIMRNNLSRGEEELLKILVRLQKATVTEFSKETNKSAQYLSKILNRCMQLRLVTVERQGKNRIYSPGLDALIAYEKH